MRLALACFGLVCGASLAQGTPAPAARLDRTTLQRTFTEDFTHFTASPAGALPQTGPTWRTTFFFGDRTLSGNHEAQWYSDASTGIIPFAVHDGVLEIAAAPAPGLPPGLTHSSGLITSQTLFAQRYGYFEMRARMPSAPGFWPAFWLLPSGGAWPPEIDAMEVVTREPRTLHLNIHSAAGGRRIDAGAAIATGDLTTGFHTYGVAWRPDVIRWYLDDVEVLARPTPADMHVPMYLLVNLAVGGPGSWPGPPATPAATATLQVGWVRAWQFPDLPATGRLPAP